MSKKSTTHIWLIVILTGVVIVLAASGLVWIKRHDLKRSVERASLPTAVPYQVVSVTPRVVSSPPVSLPTVVPKALPTIPPQANLAVPFTVQAPHANWDEAHEDFCEEASILMAISYVQSQTIPNADFAEQELQKIKTFEEKRFGYYKDTTIEEVAVTFREYYKYNQVRLIENPTIQDIKQAIAKGQLVVVPAAGRLLGNPYFTAPGPLYHMFVIKGYTADQKFIVNDPGTRRGADYLYTEDVIMNALHNWRTDEQIELGRKVILVVG